MSTEKTSGMMTDNEKLYAAILNGEEVAGELAGDIREAILHGPTWSTNFNLARWNYYKQFSDFAEKASPEEFAKVAERLYNAVGEKLYNNIGEYRYGAYRDLFFKPVFFEALLKFFDDKKMRKQMTMKEIIDLGNVELLALCARYGWLKIPRIRDEMIAYSTEKNATECTAFLLDFKNKNFDLQAERVKAEKKIERELNAAPDSVSELKKIWNFKKLEDGGLIITSYKGKREEVIVPEKIGNDVVVEIGEGAFCPFARRVTPEMKEARKAITKIMLPSSVRWIGKGAFWACEALVGVNIPVGVEAIKENTFAECKCLERLIIPQSVKLISRRAFHACARLTLILERGSYAEEYCAKNNITFKYKEEIL